MHKMHSWIIVYIITHPPRFVNNNFIIYAQQFVSFCKNHGDFVEKYLIFMRIIEKYPLLRHYPPFHFFGKRSPAAPKFAEKIFHTDAFFYFAGRDVVRESSSVRR